MLRNNVLQKLIAKKKGQGKEERMWKHQAWFPSLCLLQDVMVLNFLLTVAVLWAVKKNDDFLFMNEWIFLIYIFV